MIYAGCLGPSHAGHNIDVFDALLVMGQGIEARPDTQHSSTHLLTSNWKTDSTVQIDETFVTSSLQVKKAKSQFQ